MDIDNIFYLLSLFFFLYRISFQELRARLGWFGRIIERPIGLEIKSAICKPSELVFLSEIIISKGNLLCLILSPLQMQC
ncbi:MAG: hypothetical protein COT84_07495 [Chlamydiae bacterium CG10_big_fil_rev_8_21_14_0_10_35_9]|nr:MAG: hypothetical protein COT84_07495 [Chlamydiae bacterium CG10_big_fil_rev_8_21_14_0_10_35_9]